MYGKLFASAFTGSMFGAGADVFAVWAYVIANAQDSVVELNPPMLAAVIGSTPKRVRSAIEFLCRPDTESRNPEEDGRRLLACGPFQYKVVSHEVYRAIRNEDDRREYNRLKQREHRARIKPQSNAVNDVKPDVIDSQSQSAVSAYTEAETETETEAGGTRDLFSNEKQSSGTTSNARPKSSGVDPANEIYLVYPRQIGKRKAIEAIKNAAKRLSGGEHEGQRLPIREAQKLLFLKTRQYAKTPAGTQGTLTPHPATWFNGSRYLDDPQEWQRTGETKHGHKAEERNNHHNRIAREIIAETDESVATQKTR